MSDFLTLVLNPSSDFQDLTLILTCFISSSYGFEYSEIVLTVTPPSFLFQGLAKYVDCGTFLPVEVKRRLKSSELEAKKSRLRMWNNYMSPPTDNRAITDQNFTGKVCRSL